MELTVNNLIKMSIAVLVIVLVITGIVIGMKNYVIPYFSGIGFEAPQIEMGTQFAKELVKEENLIGTVDEDNFFIYNHRKTDIYFNFKEHKVMMLVEGAFGWDWTASDERVGNVENDGKLVITASVPHGDILDGAYWLGKEVYKIGGPVE